MKRYVSTECRFTVSILKKKENMTQPSPIDSRKRKKMPSLAKRILHVSTVRHLMHSVTVVYAFGYNPPPGVLGVNLGAHDLRGWGCQDRYNVGGKMRGMGKGDEVGGIGGKDEVRGIGGKVEYGG